MPPAPKILDRIRKLVAKSISTTFERERESFAVEAVRLIHEHGALDAPPVEEPKPQPRRRARHADPPRWEPPTVHWIPSFAPPGASCNACGADIEEGEPVFWKPSVGVIHNWPCRVG